VHGRGRPRHFAERDAFRRPGNEARQTVDAALAASDDGAVALLRARAAAAAWSAARGAKGSARVAGVKPLSPRTEAPTAASEGGSGSERAPSPLAVGTPAGESCSGSLKGCVCAVGAHSRGLCARTVHSGEELGGMMGGGDLNEGGNWRQRKKSLLATCAMRLSNIRRRLRLISS